MQDENKHTPTQRMSQMPHADIVAGVRRVIVHKFTPRDIAELRQWLRGVAMVAERKISPAGRKEMNTSAEEQ